MAEPSEPMTKEDLEKQAFLPKAYKEAIEHAIHEMADPEDPEDQIWPDYFRGVAIGFEKLMLHQENDEVDIHSWEDEAAWFQEGWKVRDRLDKK